MINRLRRQFILIAMISVTTVVFLLVLFINLFSFFSTDQSLIDTLQMIYENQGKIPSAPGGPARKGTLPPLAPEAAYSTRYFVLRYNSDGELESMDMRHIAAVTEADADVFLQIALAHGEGTGYTGWYKYYIASVRDGQYMAIFLDCQKELHAAGTFAFISILVAAACIFLVGILIWLFSKKAIEPIVKNMQKQKQFITDASHELKTPLTVISTSLKVLEMDIGKQKWLEKAQNQTEKMAELIQNLVTLARLDEEQPPLYFGNFDLSRAVTETAGSFQDVASAHGHRILPDIAPDLTFHGDEKAIRQLVSILLDNAVKYADPGSTIEISLGRTRRGLVLKTTNLCEGLDRDELDRLFDRFYRPDRSRSKQTGGFGIGLSIARGIVEAHHGTILAEYSADSAIRFIVTLK